MKCELSVHNGRSNNGFNNLWDKPGCCGYSGGIHSQRYQTTHRRICKNESQSRPQAQGLSMGDPNAPVKVEEYGDFQCPACRIFHESQEGQLIEKYIKTGLVYFTYTPFSFIGDESVKAAEAAYCAADQGKFWEYHDMLYANQTAENKGDFADSRLMPLRIT